MTSVGDRCGNRGTAVLAVEEDSDSAVSLATIRMS
jgi:hypothetical protein